jgi:hypothetical protein
MLMEPVAEQSPRSGRRGPFGFFTTRIEDESNTTSMPTLADMEAARIGLQRRLRNRRLRLIGAAGATLQRLPLLPAVARATVSVLRRETRTQ